MEGKEEEKEPTKFVGGGGGSYVPAEAEEEKEFEEMLDIHPQWNRDDIPLKATKNEGNIQKVLKLWIKERPQRLIHVLK